MAFLKEITLKSSKTTIKVLFIIVSSPFLHKAVINTIVHTTFDISIGYVF
jgi:hypothetical protein